jgi:nucleotide-binding universal stress UspA family protein
MSYKTIMVCLNEVSANDRLLEVARTLAAKFKSHVKGLYVIPGVQLYAGVAAGMGPITYDGYRIYFEKQLPKVKEAFESAMRADGLAFDFQSVDSSQPDLATVVVDNSRSADLVIMASGSRKAEDGAIDEALVELVAIGAGRPVLVVPDQGPFKFSAENITLGWNDSREAARAAYDALPLLKSAKVVHVVSVDNKQHGSVPGADLADTLARHGVKAEVSKIASDGMGAGGALLQAANDAGSGLLVMGCYGHSRLTELVFGGSTRHVLSNLDRAVLLSH